MPELPEVQTIVDELTNAVVAETIMSCRILRDSVIQGDSRHFGQILKNQRIEEIVRKGKYIVFSFSGSFWMVAHLKMTGKFILQNQSESPHKHDRVVFYLDNGRKLIFNDVRCFGRLELVEDLSAHSGLMKLGWDPWDNDLTAKTFLRKIRSRSIPIKTTLLDQSVIAGLGNIYVSEALFDAAINPTLEANSITERQVSKLLRSIRKILTLALKYNGTSISDYRRIDEKQGMFQNFLQVYGKEGQSCNKCASEIAKITQNQRSTFLCPICQK